MQKILFSLSLILLLTSCGKSNKFTIEGNIKNANGSTLYLEHVEVSKTNAIDSVKLNASGNFRFKKERSASPEFYKLILSKQSIDLAIDSTETLKIQADSATFSKNYIVEGSENCVKIKELSILRANTGSKFLQLEKSYKAKEINDEEYQKQAYLAIDSYKEVAKKYIVTEPASTAAYYALLQTISGMVIFDPYDKADNKFYGAVATQWDLHYPNSPLSKQVKNLSLQGMKELRSDRTLEYKISKTIDVFNIDLPTVSGSKVKLSETAKGKITLLEFCSYLAEGSPEHNMLLAKAYEKYKGQGFQIYQISLDPDEHAWKNAAINLPWTCVRDPQSVYSENVRLYNVNTLPAGFILNKDGEIVSRIDSYKNLESDIAKYLK